MTDWKCPGSDPLRSPRPQILPCPACGRDLEMWSDEVEITCPGCGEKVSGNLPVGCWEWCAAARDCLGADRHDRWLKIRKTQGKEVKK